MAHIFLYVCISIFRVADESPRQARNYFTRTRVGARKRRKIGKLARLAKISSYGTVKRDKYTASKRAGSGIRTKFSQDEEHLETSKPIQLLSYECLLWMRKY